MIQPGLFQFKRIYVCLFLLLSILGRGYAVTEDPKVEAAADSDSCAGTAPGFNFVPDPENPCNNTQYHLDHGITEENDVIETKRNEVQELHRDWKRTIDTQDLAGVVALYDPGALVYATFKTTLSTSKEIESYFKHLFTKDELSVTFEKHQTRIYAVNTAITSGIYTFHYSSNGTVVDVPARFTFVYLREVAGESKDTWKIIDHHSSVDPENTQLREQERLERGNALRLQVDSTMKSLWDLYNAEFL
jgi:hypothetical protein